MPPAITGPGPSIDPPRPSTPLTVLTGPAVSMSQITAPSRVEYPRKCPSTDPENATPGIAVTAADCAGLQRFLSAGQGTGGVYHTRLPVARLSANMPPPRFGSTSVLKL